MPPLQARLFDDQETLPQGFVYCAGFLAPAEEERLLGEIRALPFGEVRMHGVTARRRVAQFGWRYTFDSARVSAGDDVPPFLEPLRERAAELAGLRPSDLAEALVTEYPPGAPIGWHRDAPMFGVIVGISLSNPCRFLLRQIGGSGRIEITLEPRSAYVLAGDARSGWQHHIPPVKQLRYSITFRTLRGKR